MTTITLKIKDEFYPELMDFLDTVDEDKFEFFESRNSENKPQLGHWSKTMTFEQYQASDPMANETPEEAKKIMNKALEQMRNGTATMLSPEEFEQSINCY